MSPRKQSVSLAESQQDVIDPTNSGGALDDSVEDRLHVGRRAADDAEHLGRCRLMLQRLARDSRVCSSLAVAFSRCTDWASSWRSSAIVWACLASDVFPAGRRGFALVFFEPFFVVGAIEAKTKTETICRGRTIRMTGSRTPHKQTPLRLS